MLTKLTLSIDREVIRKAKMVAQARRTSLSRMVQDYLDRVSDNGNPEAGNDEAWPAPITDGLVGMFQDEGKDYRTLLEEALDEGNR